MRANTYTPPTITPFPTQPHIVATRHMEIEAIQIVQKLLQLLLTQEH